MAGNLHVNAPSVCLAQGIKIFKLCFWSGIALSQFHGVWAKDNSETDSVQHAPSIVLGKLQSDAFLFSKPLPPECRDPSNMDFSHCQPEPGPTNAKVRNAFGEALKASGAKIGGEPADTPFTFTLTIYHSTRYYNLGFCRMSGKASRVGTNASELQLPPQIYRVAVPETIKIEGDLTPSMSENMAATCFARYAQEIVTTLRKAK